MTINLFSPRYSWKIAELALSNNHSLVHIYYMGDVSWLLVKWTTGNIGIYLLQKNWVYMEIHVIRSRVHLCLFKIFFNSSRWKTWWGDIYQWVFSRSVISPKTPFSMTNKTDHNNNIEILLKVALDIKTNLNTGTACEPVFQWTSTMQILLIVLSITSSLSYQEMTCSHCDITEKLLFLSLYSSL